ncbi:MAG: hypothetical protein GC160_05730 [Acidobacteria bacterium]|nr:hypothetical protein [Acidobacteriota bacterium]
MNRTLRSLSLALAILAAAPGLLPGQVSNSALRVLGQINLRQNGFNSVEGAEMATPGGVAIDERDGEIHVYVADTANNRVLAWRDARSLSNGATADIALGQPSLRHTVGRGIGAKGLDGPVAAAVNPATGDLYVADTNDNRVVRFLNPFENTARVEPDKVYGQPDFTEVRANYPVPGPRTMRTPTGLSFDAAGNLWIIDSGNHRVLRYPAASLDADQPEADVALGQPNFTEIRANSGASVSATGFNLPVSAAVHPNGSLYVADASNVRVLVFNAPFTTGKAADSVIGQPDFTSRTVPATITASSMRGPNSVYINATGALFVAISQENRILVFDKIAEGATGLRNANRVIGQVGLTADQPNVGTFPAANASGLLTPGDVVGDSTGNLYVVDSGNNRLLILTAGVTPATTVLGQPDFSRNGANRVGPESLGAVTDVAVDYSTEGFPLYLADLSNSRVLAWRSSLRYADGAPADLVIGQPDFVTSIPNADTGRAQSPTATSLAIPRGLAVDGSGNLYVADTGNNRVLRFAKPFDQSGRVRAEAVLGQVGFFSSISAAVNAQSLRSPFDVAIGANGEVYVSDRGNNRVLEYPPNPSSGAAAIRVFGQPSMDVGTAPTTVSAQTLNGPAGLFVDAFNFLLVADSLSNRVVIYPLASDAPPAAVTAGTVLGQPSFSSAVSAVGPASLSAPQQVTSDPDGLIYVADSNNHRVMVFPDLLSLPSAGGVATRVIGQADLSSRAVNYNTPDGLATPQGLAQPVGLFADRRGTLYVGDTGNSRLMHFVGPAAAVSAATFHVGGDVSAGSLISLFGAHLSEEEGGAVATPLPKELANRFVEINDEFRAALLFVSPGQANLQLPVESPSGVQRLMVRRADTDEIIAGGLILVGPANPGLFTVSQDGTGQALALNQDGRLNSPANPAAKGSVIQLFGTGQGKTQPVIANGQPAPSGPLAQTPTQPATSAAECLSPGYVCALVASKVGQVLFSGLAPGFVGLWQLNVKIPDDFPDALIGDAVPIKVVINQRLGDTVTVAIR